MLEVHSVTKRSGTRRILDSLSFSLREGAPTALIGPNGAGKSTLMRILSGVLHPDEGWVHLDNADIESDLVFFRSRTAYLPEQLTLYPELSSEEYLSWIASVRGISPIRFKERCEFLEPYLQLKSILRHTIGTLSKGMRRRLGLASCLLHEPRLLLLDEPSADLDPYQQDALHRLLRFLAPGRIILVSSHQISEVAKTCSRFILLEGGALVEDGALSGSDGALPARLEARFAKLPMEAGS